MNANRALGRDPDSIPIFDITSTAEGATPPAGWMMLKEGKLRAAAKSYGIPVGGIVLGAAVLSLMAGIMAGIKFDRSRNDAFYLNGIHYVMVGIAEVPGAKNHYMPIYKTEIEAQRDYAEGKFK